MSSTVIGIIGSGNIGGGVARLAIAAGFDVVLSNSRGPESLRDLVAELGPTATADAPAGAARRADIVVVSVPLSAYRHLPAGDLDGKIVIDTMNYYPDRSGHIDLLDDSGLTSSEFVQQGLPGALVVKALNNVDFVRLPRVARPAGAIDRTALPIAGDDGEAKREVARLLDAIGFDSLDLGSLASGWRSEPGTPLSVAPYYRELIPGSSDPYQRFMGAESVPVPISDARQLAEAATRA